MSYVAVKTLGSEWTDEEIRQAQQEYFARRAQKTEQMDTLRQLYHNEVKVFHHNFVQYARLSPWTRDLETVID